VTSLRLLLRFVHSIIAPGARREGPSLAHRGSRGIHAAQPLDSLCSPCGPACGCYSAALRFITILFTLLKGRLASSVRFVWLNQKQSQNNGLQPQRFDGYRVAQPILLFCHQCLRLCGTCRSGLGRDVLVFTLVNGL